jgi:hypothetical protein
MRRFSGNMGLVLAMEADKAKAEDEDKKKDGDGAESLETDVAEVNDAAAEGDTHQAATDEAEETAEALESYRVAMTGILGNGGLDGNGAMMFQIGLEHMYNRLGIDTTSAVPAMESFGGSSSRIQATQIAMEELKDKIKEIWAAIVAAIKKAADWVMKYWNQVFGAAEKLQKRAKALVERSRDTNGTQKEKSFENDRLAKELAIDNAPPANVLQHAKDLKEATSEIVTRAAQISGDVGTKAAEAVSELKGDSVGAILSLLKPLSGEKVADPAAEGLAGVGDGISVFRSKQLFGGQAIFSRVPAAGSDSGPTQGEANVKTISAAGYSFGKFSNKVKDPTNKKLNALTNTDCAALAEVVSEIADEILAYRKQTPKLVEAQKKLATAAEKVANSAGSEEDEGKRKSLNALQGVTTMANRIFTQPGAPFMKFALTSSKALLDLVELSLKQYSAK